jgi:hypothetical protein
MGIGVRRFCELVYSMGERFGGGQIGLGSVASVACLIVLWFLKLIEEMYPRRKSALLTVEYDRMHYSQQALLDALLQGGRQATPVCASITRAVISELPVCLTPGIIASGAISPSPAIA